jgi:hypothetical protein
MLSNPSTEKLDCSRGQLDFVKKHVYINFLRIYMQLKSLKYNLVFDYQEKFIRLEKVKPFS